MNRRRAILGVTGSRAEFGLLQPVFAAIASRSELELLVAVAGAHLLPPAPTREEVAAAFPIAAEIGMQDASHSGRLADSVALGRGTLGFARTIDAMRPDIVVVLGDRIEALAAASAAAVAGVRVAHIHGGDRAEGIADESMRHAISKLAHIHLAATKTSGDRLLKMGEDAARIHVVGSPAIDGLAAIPALDDQEFARLGSPDIVVLLHPTGRDDATEERCAESLCRACANLGRTIALAPNHDPGRDAVLRGIERSGVRLVGHVPRHSFVGLLRRAKLLVGNSSAGLIEAAALPVRVVNVGARQAGRERAGNVIDEESWDSAALAAAVTRALAAPAASNGHPFGDGRTGSRIAEILADDDCAGVQIAKRNAY